MVRRYHGSLLVEIDGEVKQASFSIEVDESTDDGSSWLDLAGEAPDPPTEPGPSREPKAHDIALAFLQQPSECGFAGLHRSCTVRLLEAVRVDRTKLFERVEVEVVNGSSEPERYSAGVRYSTGHYHGGSQRECWNIELPGQPGVGRVLKSDSIAQAREQAWEELARIYGAL